MPKNLWHKVKNNEVMRFLLSAGAGFLVDASTFYLLYHHVFTQKTYKFTAFTMRNATLSLAISYCLGVAINFTLTKYMVFTGSKSSSSKQFSRFFAVAVIGFIANLAILKILIQVLDVYPPVARIGAALSLFVASFFIHKVFSFSLSIKHKRSHDTQSNHRASN
ncbi:GtrA family protein [Mucilaginibacter terrenus]|uniref:GtrA family protein n=1 Tax=Mucilaginibacter terrenus TaxID=2482727 RepID=A0A3E2NUD5_9SPHI|nr:GtrA family protein [Mucilaginibacter terrenus]RFZ84625.1 GtrA family protein [Mucilaginibacter terrenus]